MKIFISSDMEGAAGTFCWHDVKAGTNEHKKYSYSQSIELEHLMDAIRHHGNEIRDAMNYVRGYNSGNGAELKREFVIRDAHGAGNNILVEEIRHLDPIVLQNWRGANEFCMMSGLDGTFDFAILHGYHAAGGTNMSSLAHTFNSEHFKEFRLNGEIIGEVGFAIYTAAYAGVPVIMISGDSGAVREAKAINPNILGVETKDFVDGQLRWMAAAPSVNNELEIIASAALGHLERAPEKFKVELPETFALRLTYSSERQALLQPRKIPNVTRVASNTVEFKTGDFGILLKTLRQLKFLVK